MSQNHHLRGRFAPRKRATWPQALAEIALLVAMSIGLGAMLASGF